MLASVPSTYAEPAMAYSPDGWHIISGSHDCTIQIWDAETGTSVGNPLEGHTHSVSSIAYSPNGRRIISGSWDCTTQIWDAETGASVSNPLDGHAGWVRSVAYAPNGRHIISGSYDGTIRTWNSEACDEAVKPHEGSTYPIQFIRHSSDEPHTVFGPYDNTTRVWDAFTSVSARCSSWDLMYAGFYADPDMDGRVRDSEAGGLLYWVPHDCRTGLHSPALLTIPLTSRSRSVSLDSNNFVFGTSWTQIFKDARS